MAGQEPQSPKKTLKKFAIKFESRTNPKERQGRMGGSFEGFKRKSFRSTKRENQKTTKNDEHTFVDRQNVEKRRYRLHRSKFERIRKKEASEKDGCGGCCWLCDVFCWEDHVLGAGQQPAEIRMLVQTG